MNYKKTQKFSSPQRASNSVKMFPFQNSISREIPKQSKCDGICLKKKLPVGSFFIQNQNFVIRFQPLQYLLLGLLFQP